MSMMRFAAIVCIMAVVASFSGVAGDRRFEKKFDVSPGGTLSVKTDIGSVMVTGTSSTQVTIVAEMDGRQKDIDDFEIKAEKTSGGVEVVGKTHRSGWNFFRFHEMDVRYTIEVPRNYNLHLSTSGGNIAVSDIKGRIEGQTSGGDVSVSKSEGEAELGTSGGNVRVESVTGNVHAETSGGDIRVKAVKGDVDAGTSGGNVVVAEVEGKVKAETSGGNVVVKVLGGNKGVHAETSGGNVEVYVAKTCAANIDASTSGGDVECDLPVTVVGKIKDSSIKGSVNGGGPLIYAHTSGGNIRIKPLE